MVDVHVYVEVEDLERALRFYVEGLELRELRRFTARWVELTGARLPVHLLARPEQTVRVGEHVVARNFGRHWTPIHLDFVVDDLDAAVTKALAAGGTLDRATVDHHYWRMANMADPSGNGIDLIQFIHGGYPAFIASRASHTDRS